MTAGASLRLYIDSNIFIYVVEGHPTLMAPLEQMLNAIQSGAIPAVTSELTLAEVLVKPFANLNSRYLREYRMLLSGRPELPLLPVSRHVLETSAQLRATIGGKLADGIHVATAVLAKCTHLLSEDAKMKVPPGLALIKVVDLPSLLTPGLPSP